MQLQIGNDNHVIGYASTGGIEGAVEIDDDNVPEGFEQDFWPGKWAYAKKKFALTGIPKPEPPAVDPGMTQVETMQKRLDEQETALLELAEIIAGGGL